MNNITIHSTQQSTHARPYRDEADFWRVRSFLLETYPITPPGLNWDVRRWDGSRFHGDPPEWDAYWQGRVGLWEAGSSLVGVAHPEGAGNAHLEVHPDARHVEEEMIAWAEGHLAKEAEGDSQRALSFYVYEYDSWRQRLLEDRGYLKTPEWGVLRRLVLGNQLLPAVRLPAGYSLRSAGVDDPAEHQAFAELLNQAFNRTFHKALDIRNFRRLAPSYRPDLDLFAVAEDGCLAANVGVIYMPEVHAGLFEPVCTHPSHRQKGLAQALMWEGMHRLRALGAKEVTVDTGYMVPANRLYDSVGFPEMYRGYVWRKAW